jgi:hypothetical protein
VPNRRGKLEVDDIEGERKRLKNHGVKDPKQQRT